MQKYGIGKEDAFMQRRQGEVPEDVNNCGIYSVLALQAMFAGGNEVTVDAETVCKIKHALVVGNDYKSRSFSNKTADVLVNDGSRLPSLEAIANKYPSKKPKQNNNITR